MREQDKEKAILILNQIMELELSGVVRYTHYSLMVYGYHRIPIVNWLKENAQEPEPMYTESASVSRPLTCRV